MKVAMVAAGWMMLQAAAQMAGPAVGPVPEVRHLRYERAIAVPGGGSGEVCAVLDAAAFAHAASRSGDDFRVFREVTGGDAVETPFALTESEAEPGEVESAVVSGAQVRKGKLSFDLAMPKRAYTTVELEIEAKDFVGVATVEGRDGEGGKPVRMGSFAVFDWTAKGLGRSTELALQESRWGVLHVELQMWGMGGGGYAGMSAGTVSEAMVPPSRGAQTVYTTVATGPVVADTGGWVARLRVPAHVPVERVSVDLEPGDVERGDVERGGVERGGKGNFLSAVRIEARPDGGRDGGSVERVGGEISSVTLPAALSAKVGMRVFRRLSVEAALAANLRRAATVEVGIGDGPGGVRAPVRAVRLEMRQRMVCFAAVAGAEYSLRYGDGALRAPVYTEEPALAGAREATIGAERVNPEFVERSEVKAYRERHPEVLWIALLAGVIVLGAAGMQPVKRKGRR